MKYKKIIILILITFLGIIIHIPILSNKLFKVNIILNESINIVSNYSNKDKLSVLFQKTGANNIFNFKKISLINKNTKQEVILSEMGTDWLGPYIISSKYNINGDNPNSGYFTGGNHAYDNSGTEDLSDTGRTEWIKMYIDGKLITSDFNGYCNDVKIVFKNKIQAYNTTKKDGSGREVLEETYTIKTSSPGKFDIENKIVALEPIYIEKYYGIQASNLSWDDRLLYYPNTNNRWLDVYNQNNSSNDYDCDKVVLEKGNNRLTMQLNRNIGLGKLKEVNPACFTQNYGKTYFNLINSNNIKELNTCDTLSFKGYYLFEHINK